MMSREEAIKIATGAALEWYEDEDGIQPVDFIEAYQENEYWIGWLTSEWRVWEYQGKTGFEIISG